MDYIVTDLQNFKAQWQDDSLGGMVVCDSSKQAKMLFELFQERFGTQEIEADKLLIAAEPEKPPYGTRRKKKDLKAALILHDENDKGIRKELIKAYKSGKIDILFVYNMLLTGFDAKRLKKLYLARVIQDHNLLQTLKRVNRPYKKYQYGYVVDFADISKAFNRTNQLYFEELQSQLGDDVQFYNQLFKSESEIRQEIEGIRETLFRFDNENIELFSQQIAQLTDKSALIQLIKALRTAKELKNIIAINGYEGLLDITDFEVWNRLLSVAQGRLDNLNFVESIGNEEATQNILNTALEDIVFQFIKVGEEELKLADEYKDALRSIREALQNNFDQADPEFVSLREELERIFKKKNLSEANQADMVENMRLLHRIHEQAKELNRKNVLLKAKYDLDEKYTRIHKRLTEKGSLSAKEMQLHRALMQVKNSVDDKLEGQEDIMKNEAFFNKFIMQQVVYEFKKKENIALDYPTTEKINHLIVSEYLQLYNSRV